MDPLSISASAISFVAFALHSARRVKEFIDSIQGAPRAVKAISDDVHALCDVLERFAVTVNKTPTSAQASLVDPLRKPLENCENALENLSIRIKPFTKPTGDGKSSKWRNITWTFREKDINNLRNELMAYKTSLDLALSIANL